MPLRWTSLDDAPDGAAVGISGWIAPIERADRHADFLPTPQAIFRDTGALAHGYHEFPALARVFTATTG